MDEEEAIVIVETLMKDAEKSDYAALFRLVERNSMQWLVDIMKRKKPSIIAISWPSLLSTFPMVEDKVDPAINDEVWECIKRSISQTVSDYLN